MNMRLRSRRKSRFKFGPEFLRRIHTNSVRNHRIRESRVYPNEDIMISFVPGGECQIQRRMSKKITYILRQSHLRSVDYSDEIIPPEDQSKESTPSKIIGGGEFNWHYRTNILNCNG